MSPAERLTVIQYLVDSPVEAGLGPYLAARAALRRAYGGDGDFGCPFTCVDPSCLESDAAFEMPACQPDTRVLTIRTWIVADHAAQLHFGYRTGRDPNLRVMFTAR